MASKTARSRRNTACMTAAYMDKCRILDDIAMKMSLPNWKYFSNGWPLKRKLICKRNFEAFRDGHLMDVYRHNRDALQSAIDKLYDAHRVDDVDSIVRATNLIMHPLPDFHTGRRLEKPVTEILKQIESTLPAL